VCPALFAGRTLFNSATHRFLRCSFTSKCRSRHITNHISHLLLQAANRLCLRVNRLCHGARLLCRRSRRLYHRSRRLCLRSCLLCLGVSRLCHGSSLLCLRVSRLCLRSRRLCHGVNVQCPFLAQKGRYLIFQRSWRRQRFTISSTSISSGPSFHLV